MQIPLIFTENEHRDLLMKLEEHHIFDFDKKDVRIHNIQTSLKKEAEHGLSFVPTIVFDHPTFRGNTPLLFEIFDSRDEEKVLAAVEEIVEDRKIEKSLDVFALQKVLEKDKDLLNLTIAKLTVYGSSYPKNVTSSNGKNDWNIGGGFFVETNRAFYSVPGYGTLRQLKQTIAACDLSDNPSEATSWHYGGDAMQMAVKDPEILRAYHVHQQEIHKNKEKLSKSSNFVYQEVSERAPQGLYRNPLPEVGGVFAEANLSYDPKLQSPKYIEKYFAKHEIILTEQQAAQLTIADSMGVVNPYEVVGMVKEAYKNPEIIDKVIALYTPMIEIVRQRNENYSLTDLDRYDLQSISSASLVGSTLVERGYIGRYNQEKFINYDHQGDQHINQVSIDYFSQSLEKIIEKKQSHSR